MKKKKFLILKMSFSIIWGTFVYQQAFKTVFWRVTITVLVLKMQKKFVKPLSPYLLISKLPQISPTPFEGESDHKKYPPGKLWKEVATEFNDNIRKKSLEKKSFACKKKVDWKSGLSFCLFRVVFYWKKEFNIILKI